MTSFASIRPESQADREAVARVHREHVRRELRRSTAGPVARGAEAISYPIAIDAPID